MTEELVDPPTTPRKSRTPLAATCLAALAYVPIFIASALGFAVGKGMRAIGTGAKARDLPAEPVR